VNVPSKAFGELVESKRHTRRWRPKRSRPCSTAARTWWWSMHAASTNTRT
jgi:hypothetical protein